MSTPRHPEIAVQLSGVDGNAFAIMARVSKAMRRAGLPDEEVDAYLTEATSGNYDHLIRTTMAWVSVS